MPFFFEAAILSRMRCLDQTGKIGERPGQPVDLVDDDDVDPSSANIGEQALQSRPLHIATGEPAVVIAGSRRCPALVLLAADVGLAGFALSSERVEFLVEPLLGGFAGVDRATPAARVSRWHRSPLWLVRISQDGTWIAFRAPVDGVLNLWVVSIDRIEDARPVTAVTDRNLGPWIVWMHDNQHVVFFREAAGDENGARGGSLLKPAMCGR